MKDKAAGFYLTIVAAIASGAGLFFYPSVMYRLAIVYIFCITAVILTICAIVSSVMGKKYLFFNYVPVINSALMASAAIWAVYLMVNQIGYVIAKLDDKSTLTGFLCFEVAAVLAIVINITSSFMKQDKN